MSAALVHRLGIVLSLMAAVAYVAMAVVEARRDRAAGRRLAALLPGGRTDGDTGTVRKRARERWRARTDEGAALAWAASVGVLLAGVVLVGGPPGWVLGLAAAYGVRRWQRRQTAARRSGGRSGGAGSEAAEAERQIPLAADLLAACLAAGADPRTAADAVGKSLGGPVGDRLVRTAAELRLGGEPAGAWGRLGALPGASGLARALEHAGTTGAPAVEPVSRIAADCRAEQGRESGRRADRASVLATAPLGACFLPAYLLIGVAPVMTGLAGGLAGHT
ncbi:type II secretion system F family protein [Streptomyces sp. Rer75]|uniref:type II secretion system F family protein n=1 Tax=unclassified Streptomyces TaxID=2593676 RepID=UPI0015CFAA16|nr:type II secretion system F family protein [Streptomyces sp. Rer75]QLH22695.1 type II secretion system F family protein [Streptomyces sp. Rer75]